MTDEVSQNWSEIKKLIDLFKDNKEMMAYCALKQDIVIISVEKNLIRYNYRNKLTDTVKTFVITKLKEWTSNNWQWDLVDTLYPNFITYSEYEEKSILESEMVTQVMSVFPGAKITKIKTKTE